MRTAALLIFALACRQAPDDTDQVDEDGDGIAAGEDCDDTNASVFPGAEETCNEADDDCDGEVDEDASDAATFYADADGDGHGDPDQSLTACLAPEGYVAANDDCDDEDADAHPGAVEACGGGDEDCDGEVDEDASDAATFYADADGDGHGDPDQSLTACAAPEGHVAADHDCDDGNADAHPGAVEVCGGGDEDCDGETDEDASDVGTFYADADGDGHGDPDQRVAGCEAPEGHVAANDDCDDSSAAAYPGAPEPDCADPVDYNCDGSTGYADADGDGIAACEDCDDADASAYPGGTEACGGGDEDCDGQTDEADATGASTWYADADGDGFGAADTAQAACVQPASTAANDDDCDDALAAVHPGADERCNGDDDDCDGQTDEGAVDATPWFADVDDDGYGDPDQRQLACEAPSGHVGDATDCDDADGASWPGAPEACDGVDNDCDEAVPADEADDDDDGYRVCEEDCDDALASVHPDADERCNGDDDDCDGETDEDDAVDRLTWYRDADEDGVGGEETALACEAPSGFVDVDGDCDDSDDSSYPEAPLGCDGVDHDCDGDIDHDDDEDGFSDYTCGGDDCADDDANQNPIDGCIGSDCSDIVARGFDEGDGLYSIDPDGLYTGAAPFDAWCDMTTDGGGWTLVARTHNGTTAEHRTRAAVGTLTSPTQTTTAKFADTRINELRGSDYTSSVLRMNTADGNVDYFREGREFNAIGYTNSINRVYDTWATAQSQSGACNGTYNGTYHTGLVGWTCYQHMIYADNPGSRSLNYQAATVWVKRL